MLYTKQPTPDQSPVELEENSIGQDNLQQPENSINILRDEPWIIKSWGVKTNMSSVKDIRNSQKIGSMNLLSDTKRCLDGQSTPVLTWNKFFHLVASHTKVRDMPSEVAEHKRNVQRQVFVRNMKAKAK